MSARKPTRGPYVAFTERVRESITGFEVCTVMETDRNNHPRLLAIVHKKADADLFAAAPNLISRLKLAAARLARVDGGDTYVVSEIIDAIAEATGEDFDVEAFIAAEDAEAAKAEGRS